MKKRDVGYKKGCMNQMKDKVKPLYSELQGYLSQAPNREGYFHTKEVWEQFNGVVNELNNTTGKDYSRFKITPSGHEEPYTTVGEYRSKLSGLISRLHGEYFSDEAPPFSGSPTTVVTQTQTQQQSAHVVMLLEIQSKIDKKLSKVDEGEEKDFLQTLKSKLGYVKDTAELIKLIVTTAQSFGVSLDKLGQIFS